MNYLEVENNDLHFSCESDFEKTVTIFQQKNIPFQIFDNDDNDGYYEKFVIVDKSNKAFLSLEINIVKATYKNLKRVKISKEIERMRQVFNETLTAQNEKQFSFDPYDDFLAFRLAMAKKKEIELLNELSKITNEKKVQKTG